MSIDIHRFFLVTPEDHKIIYTISNWLIIDLDLCYYWNFHIKP